MTTRICKVLCPRQLENFDGEYLWWRPILIYKSINLLLIQARSECIECWFKLKEGATEIKKLKGSWTVIHLLIHRSQGFSQNSNDLEKDWRCFSLNDIKIAFHKRNQKRVIKANRLRVWTGFEVISASS